MNDDFSKNNLTLEQLMILLAKVNLQNNQSKSAPTMLQTLLAENGTSIEDYNKMDEKGKRTAREYDNEQAALI